MPPLTKLHSSTVSSKVCQDGRIETQTSFGPMFTMGGATRIWSGGRLYTPAAEDERND